MSELLNALNPKQYEAVTAPETSVLILAGAGSGKTRVLTTRIAWLLRENRAQTGDILAVTFTNKAAKEMLTRLESMLPYDLRRMWVGTFHGLCNRILRRHADEAGLPKTFQILDSGDQLSMVKRVMKTLNVDPDQVDPRQVQNFINWNKENGIRANRAASGMDDRNPGVAIYAAYEQQCQREGVVDFAELLLRCYELLDRNELIRTHYQNRFRHILVDEFQDTNVLQYRWLQILAGMGRAPDGGAMNAVFAVGDDDQSIYAFRGANVGNMSDFLRDFNVGEPIRLEENYRSTSCILDAANALISNNTSRLGKNLWTAGAKGDRIGAVKHENDRDEARWIAREIEAHTQRGRSYRDHAVLYRMNAQSRALESAFNAAGIPYRVYGGQRFFERAEVKHVLAYLRLLDNPGDDTSFLRIVNFPRRGIGAKTLDALADEARMRGICLWDALNDASIHCAPKLQMFGALMHKMREEAAPLNLPDAINLVIERSGLKQHYLADRDGEERLANMNEIMSAAKGYLDNEGISNKQPVFESIDGEASALQGFLTQATLEAGDKNEDAGIDAVQMMTVHAAKGLEFDTVFIAGAEEGIFPHFSAIKEGKGVDEERRLMYVAITRAKRRLSISYCNERMLHGETRYNAPSSFLEEIPDTLLESIDRSERRQSWSSGGSRGDSRYGWEKPSFGGSGSSYGRSNGYGQSSYGNKDRDDWRRGLGSGGKTYQAAKDPLVQRSAAKTASQAGFAMGENVRHKKFGEGVVEAVSGSGSDARIRIHFATAGTKELLLSLAGKNLEKV